MATVQSQQLAQDNNANVRVYPIDRHGKFRVQYFKYENLTGGTLADGTEIDLFDLPPGRVRVFPKLSSYRTTALGAARVLDIGHRAYYPSYNPGTAEIEDDDAFVANKDVSAAVSDAAFDGGQTKIKFDLFSRNGVRVYATVDGGTIPANGIIEGYMVYVYE